MNFCRSIIIAELYGGLKTQDVFHFVRFLDKRPLTEKIVKIVSKGFIATSITALCSNFVKFGRREIGKFVRYSP